MCDIPTMAAALLELLVFESKQMLFVFLMSRFSISRDAADLCFPVSSQRNQRWRDGNSSNRWTLFHNKSETRVFLHCSAHGQYGLVVMLPVKIKNIWFKGWSLLLSWMKMYCFHIYALFTLFLRFSDYAFLIYPFRFFFSLLTLQSRLNIKSHELFPKPLKLIYVKHIIHLMF